MADTSNNTGTGAPIEALLRERARYNEWLTKLDGASSGVPHAVRDKVRTDYDARLRRVMEELKSHAATIRDDLARHRSAHTDLEARRSAAEEALAEASVRHTVGEYSDDEWRRLSEETSQALGLVQADLAKVRAEITRLVEVQTLIADRPQPGGVGGSGVSSGVAASVAAPSLVNSPTAPLASPSADAAEHRNSTRSHARRVRRSEFDAAIRAGNPTGAGRRCGAEVRAETHGRSEPPALGRGGGGGGRRRARVPQVGER